MKNTRINSLFIALLCLFFISGCGKDDTPGGEEKIYRFESSITVDGRTRTYLLNLPPDYYENANYALVIAMHGGGGSAKQFETSTRLTAKAAASGFIVVYPEGVESPGTLKARTWNAGGCCSYAAASNIDDVKFISQLIDELVAKYKINVKKVYATGHSNGGMLAYRLACEIGNKIAAIAPNGCTMVVQQPCNPARPMPILHMHSMLDENVPYEGGIGTEGPSAHYNPPLDSVFGVWSSKNQCGTANQVMVDDAKFRLAKWSDCAGSSEIRYYLTKDGGHAWPGGLPGSAMGDTPSQNIDANDLLWEFFQRFSLPCKGQALMNDYITRMQNHTE